MENLDFRPPILKNISAAFAAPVTFLAALCFLLAAVSGLLSLPLSPAVLAVCALWVVGAAALFALFAAAKHPGGLSPAALGVLCALCFFKALLLLAAGAAALLWPQRIPAEALRAVASAAKIDAAYTAGLFWLLFGLSLSCFLGFGLFFRAAGRTVSDGIPRRRGGGLLCLLAPVTAAGGGYIAVMYTLGRDFDAVLRFGELLSYNFIPALPAVFCFLGIAFLCIACQKYSGAVKRSTNV